MRLKQLLSLEGGVHEQGRPIEFTLRYSLNGVPHQRRQHAVMLPISEVTIKRITEESARAEKGLVPALEFTIRFLQASLRDPGDLSKPLIEDENDMQALRDGLVGAQYGWLGDEYKRLMADEYGDLTPVQTAALKAEAEDFSKGTPGEPSSS